MIRELSMGELRKYLDAVMTALEGVQPALQIPGAALIARGVPTKAGIFNGHPEQEKEIKQKEGEERQ